MEQPKFCPHCGVEVVGQMRFCTSCGKSVTNEASVVTPAKKTSPGIIILLVLVVLSCAGVAGLSKLGAPVGAATDVRGYAQEVSGYTGALATALDRMGNLMGSPRVGNDAWSIDLAAEMAAIRQSHEQIKAMRNIPPTMTDVQASLIRATSDCNDATYLIASGIDQGRATDLDQATRLMGSCTDKIVSTTDLLRSKL